MSKTKTMKVERIIYVVGFTPAVHSTSGVGGFDWFVSASEGRQYLAMSLSKDLDCNFDHVFRRVEVPKDIWEGDSRERITRWLDLHRQLWETASQEGFANEAKQNDTGGHIAALPGYDLATRSVVTFNADSDSADYLYSNVDECEASGDHLADCDDDGFCNHCGEQ